MIHLRHPKFFETGKYATHNILNHTFHPITEPKYETTLLYARPSSPNDFINQVLRATTDDKAVIQFEANHYTFLAKNESHEVDTPMASETTGNVSH